MTTLHISDDLQLPAEAVTETFAILAKRGVGKTYTAAVMTEEMIKAGLPVVVVDPIGVWWGLRSSADGTKPGLPVVILGGEHGDVPLEPTGGHVVADLLVDHPTPLVIDLSLFRKGQARSFMTDFLEQLYQRNRDPLHVVLDEADEWAPQRPMRGAERLLGAVEDLVRRGRARGLGVTLITQRPAVIHKDVLTQTEVLVALRIIGPQDRDAIDAWIKVHGTAEQRAQLLASLAKLPVGEAWWWSPGWLDIFLQTKARPRETFDSSATPKSGQRRNEPRALADVDLEALKSRMADTIERAQADDPKMLRRRIADLEKQLAQRLTEKVVETVVERVEVPVLDEALVVRLEEALQPATGLLAEVQERLAWDVRQRDDVLEFKRKLASRAPRQQAPTQRPTPRRATEPTRQHPELTGALPRGEQRILTAVAQYPHGVTREQLTVLTGYKRSSRDTYLQRLRERGCIDTAGPAITATPEGVDTLGPHFEPLPTGAALRDHWLAELPEGERRILAELIAAYPDGVPRDDLSDTTGYKRSSRDTYLQRLRARQLVTTTGDPRAADVLFEGGG